MFTIDKFALQSIAYQRFRSLMFFFCIFIVTTSLFATAVFTESMQAGVERTQGKVGADIIIVPSSYDEDAQEALFQGKANTILFDKDLSQEIASVDGVGQVAKQLYFESLGASCCENVDTQLVAVDPENDFLISEWMREHDMKNLGEDEVIIGSVVGLKPGDTLIFYGRKLKVAGKLEETGIGYDSCLFISYDTANLITTSPQYKDIFDGQTDLVSMILVKTSDGFPIEDVKDNIAKTLENEEATVYAMDSLVGTLMRQLSYFKLFGNVMELFIIILAAVSLFTIITISFDQRRSRVGSLLSVGITKNKIIKMFLLEYGILMSLGIGAGLLLVGIFLLPLHDVIKQFVDMPYQFIGIGNILLLALQTIGINVLILLVASSLSFYRIMKLEPAILVGDQS